MKHRSGPRGRIGSLGLALALVALAAGGCGFQPRGQGPGAADLPSPLFISGLAAFSPQGREFKRQLNAAGVEIATSPAQSDAMLQIERWIRDRRVLSVDSRNKAVEYELEEIAQFRLRSRDGQELLPLQTERAVRIQYQPRDSVLGSARESELLRDDMVRDLVARIVRRLATVQ